MVSLKNLNFPTLFRLAYWDGRRNRSRLILFVSSIVAGIASLVALQSFSQNLQHDIAGQAKQLLGADAVLSGTQPPPPSVQFLLDSLGKRGERTDITNFFTMAYFPKTDGTRSVQIKARRGQYPFFGTMKVEPEGANEKLETGQFALLDKPLMLQFDLKVGDSVKVGALSYQIIGEVISAPGRAAMGASIAPAIYLPLNRLDSAHLLQRGSRIEYQYNYRFQENTNIENLNKNLRERLEKDHYRIETAAERQRNTGEAFNQMTDFLNLIGFIALLLGCIGVASAVNIYIKGKLATVAILRTLGASGQQAFLIFLIQIAFMGLGGAVVGAILGTGLQKIIPKVLSEFLPIDNVSTNPSFSAISQGVIIGLGMSVLFALLPLLMIRRTSPLRVLRGNDDAETSRDPIRWLIYGLIFISIFGFSWFQTKSINVSLGFMGGVGAALLLLTAIAMSLMVLLRKFFPSGWSYVFRQGIANLYRPNNQTVTLVVSIGLGTMLISTLLLIQQLLLKQISFAGAGSQPNMIVFDIQSADKQAVAELVRQSSMPVIQQVPVVTIHLEAIDGKTRDDFKLQRDLDGLKKRDKSTIPKWVFEREYRVTYRDTLISSEQMLEGTMPNIERPAVSADGVIGVTIAERIAENMNAKVGTRLTFNVQGVIKETIVTGIRKVDFNRMQTNFFVVFPENALAKDVPQFHVVVTRTASAAQSAAFQTVMVKKFPSVSVVDLNGVLKTVDEVLTKVAFVIRFMAMFSILTGLLVLIGSVFLTQFQRVRESVLLRTLGASRWQILNINGLEYLLLGLLSSFAGVILSVGATYALSKFIFATPFSIDWKPLILTPLIITGLVVIIGLLNMRGIVRKSPLEVLRSVIG
jgi:putative ABC transport system permease protein